MPYREYECPDCGSILDLFTPKENVTERIFCPNCASDHMIQISYLDDLTTDEAKKLIKDLKKNKSGILN